jgi:NAD(P)-dependent dehydrogenase (short-subunit alcohol dehydrogenase family)
MIEGGGGSIINIASISGIVGQKQRHVYNASKGAVVNLTRAMAISYGPQNIRVNAVSPAAVDTPLARSISKATGKSWEQMVESFVKTYAIKRVGQPIDIAYGCLYLASDEASWVTGANLVIDGGFTAQ